MDKKQINGVCISLSSQVASRLRITPSAYLSPIVSAMYLRACGRVRSGHQDLESKYKQANEDVFILCHVLRFILWKGNLIRTNVTDALR